MIEFEFTLDLEGRTLPVSVEADGHVYRENYGADADGNRGEMRTFLDDLEITIKDGRGNDITEKVQKKYKTQYKSIEDMAEEKLFDDYESEPEWEGDDYEM